MKTIVIIVSSFCLLASSVATEQRPNILVILADNRGRRVERVTFAWERGSVRDWA